MKFAQHKEVAMTFCNKYEGWHSFDNDALTLRVIKSLEKSGKIEVNEFHQFRKAVK